jgi:NADPH:quinone reductase-like Zn-dependent oxidoreductase
VKIVRVHSPGGYDRLSLETAPDPAPGPGEVAVDVEASGVNFADCIVRLGLYASAKVYVGWPITPGFEVAGTVSAVGDGVADLAPGAPVMAVTRFGGYATRVVVPRRQVFRRPAGFSAAEAAGFPAVHLTAWFALHECTRPRAGDRVLVHSAAGGVGLAICRLARNAGLEVTGVVGGPQKVDAARRAGAAHVIDKSSADLWAEARRVAPGGFRAVFDANGVETLRASYDHLAPTGRLVVYGFHTMFRKGGGGRAPWWKLAWGWLRTPRFSPLRLTTENRSVMAFNLSFLFEMEHFLAEGMADLLRARDEGKIDPPPVATYPLERVADAHRDIESGRTVGKLVLLCR